MYSKTNQVSKCMTILVWLYLRNLSKIFKCNEGRDGIIKNRYAKYRCNILVVVRIYDSNNSNCELNNILHQYTASLPKIKYIVGKYVIPDDFV